MKVLLDTHVLIWFLSDSEELGEDARSLIEQSEVFYSAASPWEVQIKHQSSPERMPATAEQLIELCHDSNILPLPISEEHVAALDGLEREGEPPRHKDPFDRILLAQAKIEGMILLTRDGRILGYGEDCVRGI